MSKMIFVLPEEASIAAVKLVAERYNQDLDVVQFTGDTLLEDFIQKLVLQNYEIFISRGSLAIEIAKLITLPVIEIRITRMELYQMLLKAKKMSTVPCPRVALICARNMLCDLTGLGELAGVELVPYIGDSMTEVIKSGAMAVAEGADVLLRGVGNASASFPYEMPSIIFYSQSDAIETALRMARQMSDTLDLAKAYNERQKILLDHSGSGLVLLDQAGHIEQMNALAQVMLSCSSEECYGRNIDRYVPVVDETVMRRVLQDGDDVWGLQQKIGDSWHTLSLSPVHSKDYHSGAVLSITEGNRVDIGARQLRKDAFDFSLGENLTFDSFPCRSAGMHAVLDKAKRCAAFRLPMLLLGEVGTEKETIARCMHEESALKEMPFFSIHCASEPPDVIWNKLFGEKSILNGMKGVLYLDDVAALSPESQSGLYQLIARQRFIPDSMPSLWIIAASEETLPDLVRRKNFRRDLCYALSSVVISIPPLRNRPEDGIVWAQTFLKILQAQMGRYLHLTQDAWQCLSRYSWPGNVEQLYDVCQQLLVQAPRRTVSEEFLRSILLREEPLKEDKTLFSTPGDFPLVESEPEKIRRLLSLYSGSRMQTANALGISSATLWRKMKKYGIT